MVTKTDVQSAAARYRRALAAIGIEGTATVVWGSSVNGVSHILEFSSPDLQHPEIERLGHSYREAERTLSGMAAAIEATARAMKRRDRPRTRVRRSGEDGPPGY